MLKTFKIKFSDPLEKNVGYSSIRLNKDIVLFKQKCVVILLLKPLKLKICDERENYRNSLIR